MSPSYPLNADGITPEMVLKAYAIGLFPMAEDAQDEALFFVEPERRGVFPLRGFHVPRSLKKVVRGGVFDVRINTAFDAVLLACAGGDEHRPHTWISGRIRELYVALYEMGHAHSVECWQDDALVGGLYGVSLGGAFFGESMFSRVTNASKVALVYLVARLMAGGYGLLDAQFITDHLRRFGAVEIPQGQYLKLLEDALALPCQPFDLICDVDGPIEMIDQFQARYRTL